MLFQKDVAEFSNIGDCSPHRDCGGSLQIDWQKLASVELSELTALSIVDSSLLMDHYPYVCLCDAFSELDLKKAADQKSLLKLFRIAQLLVQLFAAKERNLRRDLDSTKKELLQYMDKYTQCKSQLHQQIAEAKKMKVNNKNLRETVKHINSTAISKGLLQPVKCQHCYKIFRDKNFLASHQHRKHGIIERPLTYRVSNASSARRPNLDYDFGLAHRGASEPTHGIELSFDIAHGSDEPPKLPVNGAMGSTQQCKHSETVNSNFVASVSRREPRMDVETTKRLSEVQDTCSELREKMEKMATNFKQKELEWKAELEKNRNEYLVVHSEKVILEEKFRAQFEIMNSKIKKFEEQTQNLRMLEAQLPSLHRKHVGQENSFCLENFIHGIEDNTKIAEVKEKSEIVQNRTTIPMGELKAKLIADRLIQRENNDLESEKSCSSYYNAAGLSSIAEMSAEDETNNFKQDSICDVKSLPSDNEHQNQPDEPEKFNEEPSQRRKYNEEPHAREHKQDIPNDLNTAQDDRAVREKVRFVEGVAQEFSVQKSVHVPTWPKNEPISDHKSTETQSNMYGDDGSDDTESDTSAVENEQDVHDQVANTISQDSTSDEETEDDSIDESLKEKSDETKQDLRNSSNEANLEKEDGMKNSNIQDLIRDNSELWVELREATSEVVQDRLKTLIVEEKVSSKRYKKVMRDLQQQRNALSRKYPDFEAIRNVLKKEIHLKVKQTLQEEDTPDCSNNIASTKSTKKKRTFSMFKNATRKVKSTLSKKSQSSRKIVSPSSNVAPETKVPSSISAIPAIGHVHQRSQSTSQSGNSSSQKTLNNFNSPRTKLVTNCGNLTDTDTVSGSDDDSDVRNQVQIQKERTSNGSRENSKAEHKSKARCQKEDSKGIDNPAFSASGDSVMGDENQDGESDEVSSVKGIDNLAYSHSLVDPSQEKQEEELQNVTDYSSDFTTDDDQNESNDDENDDDESDQENASDDEKFKPQTKVGNLFKTESQNNSESEAARYNADAFYSSYYNVQEYKPIKLKQPTGRKIIQLKADIESQLLQRHVKKPAGAVDTVRDASFKESSEETQVEGAPDFRTEVEAFEMSSDS